MKFIIKHNIEGRLRVHMSQPRMSCRQADTLQYFLEQQEGVEKVTVYEQTCDAVILYHGGQESLIGALRNFHYETVELPDSVSSSSGRELNAEYKQKLVGHVAKRLFTRYLLPAPLRSVYTAWKSLHYIKEGLKCLAKGQLQVPVLDGTAIGVSVLRGDFNTAGSVMFLLGLGDILEEWTHKKSVGDLARSMSLNVGKVWIKQDGQEILVDSASVQAGDHVVVHMGNVIPFDGEVTEGEAMVNQASMTGESQPVRKTTDSYVYAGTVVEEGEITVLVRAVGGATKYEKIVEMIEDSQKLKSAVESRAEHLADRLVPYTFLGTGLAWLLTRNITRTLSVLMVDFSCALKLAMPLTVLTAIREANAAKITVKGGKYLEACAEASTIVFDKTGTLTKAQPTVKCVETFGKQNEDEMLRLAACLEEHFPHSMAKAVVRAAKERHLEHEEMHSKVAYIVAHGIASHVGEKRVVIGSYHFVFEDEKCQIRPEYQKRFDELPLQYSHLYLAIDNMLEAVICIEDPVRDEAPEVIRKLRREGFDKIVMMTGDSERTAQAIAGQLGVDEFYAEVLPEDKAAFIKKEKEAGRKVIMVGDGINDSPALSEADVGIAISDGAELAREIADVTVAADSLRELVFLRQLSREMLRRIHSNYRAILGINGSLIAAGVAGLIQPTTSALLHNTSTIALSLKSMTWKVPED
ncbi:MAG: heavy metal translocating P-type ATPase [Eubacteriales bacterium]|nr:heavy metal translocating P-type ATPase [Eubacteriales bacterium]